MSEVAMPASVGRIGSAFQRAVTYLGYAADVVAPLIPGMRVFNPRSKQVVVDGLTIRCHYAPPGDAEFIAACEQLYARSPDATPFQSIDWQNTLLETASATRRLRLFTVYDLGRLVAVFPLEARRGKILRSAGRILSDYLDPLIDPDYGARCWPALLRSLKEFAPGRSIVIDNLRRESIACNDGHLAHLRSAGFDSNVESDGSVARVKLPGSWEEYLAGLDGHDRRELKRQLRKADEKGGAVFDVCNDPTVIPSQIDAMLETIRMNGGGKSLKARWLFPRHFAACARRLAESGRLAICTLFIENKPAARSIQLPTALGFIGWNTTFDPSMRQWSPGIVLLAKILQLSIQRGYHVHDMLRGQQDYKYRLGAIDHPLQRLTIRPAA